jgi:GNAT superfamily N-acetyltransferase
LRRTTHFRGKGLMPELLTAAVNRAAGHGARIVEAYPVEPGSKSPSAALYTGIVPVFQRAGFVEVCRRSKRQPVMRKTVGR